MRTPDVPAGGRRASAVIVAALTVAAVVVGVAAVRLSGTPSATPSAGPASPSATPEPASTIELDLGPGGNPEAVAGCVGEGFAEDPDDVEVLYDVVQRAPEGPTAVLVLRNPDGDLRLCDMAGADVPAVLPPPEPTPGDPVAFLTNGTGVWDCDGLVLGGYRSTTWLTVGPAVARVQQRYLVDGQPGPWFGTAASGGYAHLQSWLGPQPAGVRIVVEVRVLDAAGDPVEQSALPAREALAGCTGVDVQIG